MKNITKIFILLGIIMIILAPIPSSSRTAVDEFFDRGVEKNYYIDMNIGQKLYIELSASIGNISITVVNQQKGIDIKLNFVGDEEYIIDFNISVFLAIVLFSDIDFQGYIKIYSEGFSTSTFNQGIAGVVFLLFALVAELFLRRKSISPYLIDEDSRINFIGITIVLSPSYLFGLPFIWSTMYDTKYQDGREYYIYLPDRYIYDIYISTITGILISFIILLVVLTSPIKYKRSPYSVYPIDTKQQYLARVTIYLTSLFALSLNYFVVALFNGEYAGNKFIGVYILAFIGSYTTLSFITLIQIFVTDILRINKITQYIFPASIIVYKIMFDQSNIIIYHLFTIRLGSILPYLWYIFLEVGLGLILIVYLNLRIRKSPSFIAN